MNIDPFDLRVALRLVLQLELFLRGVLIRAILNDHMPDDLTIDPLSRWNDLSD